MDKAFESFYHKCEEANWWFKGRRNVIFNLLKRYGVHEDDKILDIGCSGGALLNFLRQKGFKNLFGIDISQSAINICKEKNLPNVFLMNAERPQFDYAFDCIIASDILEHISDDLSALTAWNRILKPGGKIIVFVPAFKFLWSSHDETNHHFRRYIKCELVKILRKSGFYSEKVSYWNFLLFFPMCFMKMLACAKKETGYLGEPNFLLNGFLMWILIVENTILKIMNFPFGVSVFAVVKKNS